MTNFGVYYRGKLQKENATEMSETNKNQTHQALPNEILTSDDLAILASYINLFSSMVDLASLYLAKQEDLASQQEGQDNNSSSPNAAVT